MIYIHNVRELVEQKNYLRLMKLIDLHIPEVTRYEHLGAKGMCLVDSLLNFRELVYDIVKRHQPDYAGGVPWALVDRSLEVADDVAIMSQAEEPVDVQLFFYARVKPDEAGRILKAKHEKRAQKTAETKAKKYKDRERAILQVAASLRIRGKKGKAEHIYNNWGSIPQLEDKDKIGVDRISRLLSS